MRQIERREIALAAVLASLAGYVDALGFIGTGGLFVSFMSGNSTQAGVEALDGGFDIAVLSGLLVAGFVAGVTIGSLDAARGGAHRVRVVLSAAAALAAAGVIGLLWPEATGRFVLLAAAMGSMNTLYVADGRARIAITYATGTLVTLGVAIADRIRGRSHGAWVRPLILWGALVVGAAVGATLVFVAPAAALPVAIAALLAVAVVVARPDRRRTADPA